MLNWKESEELLREFLSWIKENSVITDYDERNLNIKEIFILVKKIKEIKETIIDEDKEVFGFNQFLLLDNAQKAFVILSTADKRLSKKDLSEKIESNFKLIVNTSYLNQVKWFSQIRKQIHHSKSKNTKYIQIKKYLDNHPKIKKLGCGKFSLNFHKHVKNLISFLHEKN